MARTHLTASDFDGTAPAAPVPNDAFSPGQDAGPAHHTLEGTLALESAVLSASDKRLAEAFVLGGDPRRFPALEFTVTTCDGELLPAVRTLIRKPDPDSYWDVMVGPGRVWSEPGDGGMSRAAFPFQLSNEHENDSHHGLASLLFDNNGISDLLVQKVTETEPDHLPEQFDLWGRVPARLMPGRVDAPAVHAARRDERGGEHPIRPVGELADRVGHDLIAALDEGVGSDTAIVSGLVVDGTIYANDVRTRHGVFPFPRAMRFGMWSATKAAFGTTALLRLARHMGPEVARTRVRDVVEVGAGHDGWDDVTIGDCLNMATGIGTAGRSAEPVDVYADNQTEPESADSDPDSAACYHAYQDWYAARSRADKLACAFACPSYPWGPGEVARYRDQDLFMAGVAMDAVWKRENGAEADLFAMVRNEVYAPIGIAHADMNRTREGEGAGVPLTAFGLYLGLDDIARLGRLLTDGGRHDGEQLLEPTLLASCLDGAFDKGLPTGTFTAEDREVTYHLAYWQLPMTTRAERDVRIPSMRGYGGQIVQPLWNGITCFRFGHDVPDKQERYDALKLPRIADALRPL